MTRILEELEKDVERLERIVYGALISILTVLMIVGLITVMNMVFS